MPSPLSALSPLSHDDPVAFGPYLLIARLGGGGMGTVYLARSAGGRVVALKTLHAHLASDSAFRTRFRLETDAARVIGGHHGAVVVDADPLAETPWLATEYVLGPPLGDAVQLAGPLPEVTVRALGAALAGALGQLHASDVVHRDLKPSNVLVTAYGPKIIDFGIARAAGDDRLTRVGSAAGTPAFMSPEQASGQEHEPAGDVFALAGVLVHAATGHGPFGSGQPADLLYRVRYADPDLSGVPDALVPVLARCLAKEPRERPTTQELAAQLHDGRDEFVDHLPDTLLAEIARRATEVWRYEPARRPAPPEPRPHSTVAAALPTAGLSRRRLAVSGGAALAATAVGVGLWSWLRNPTDSGDTVAAPGSRPGGATPDDLPPPADSTDLRQAWRKNLRSETLLLTPRSVGDTVAMMTADGLLGITPANGERRWLAATIRNPRHVHATGKTIHALVPGGSHGHQLSLHTVDPTSGRTAPTTSFAAFDKPVQRAALLQVSADTAYLVAEKSAPGASAAVRAGSWHVLAVGLDGGRERWATPLRSYELDSPDDMILSAVVGDRLILCRRSADGGALDVSARDARTGAKLWETAVPRDRSAESPRTPGALTVDDRHVYVGASRLQAIRVTDGGTAWTFGKGRAPGSYSAPVLRDAIVYAAERDQGVVAVSAADGGLRWEARTGDNPDPRVQPAVSGKFVFLMCDSSVRAVELEDRSESWAFQLASGSLCLPETVERLLLADRAWVTAVRLDYSPPPTGSP
ncbi:protein kinase [Streptomyces sp. NPDC020965]|uniref:serine/threonine-protein kinase n=1 Tax=Streptomyces sp. NPDC020965 TaxID=3365105 RepID=UPI0037951E8C